MRFSVRGPVIALPDAVELVAYRVVQEALTNVRRHADGAAVEVSLDYTPTLLRVAVRDHGPGGSAGLGDDADAAGFGLLGMRERVEAIGGTFTAGDHPDGGFEIVADLPVASTRDGADPGDDRRRPRDRALRIRRPARHSRRHLCRRHCP